jgi:Protein of unknown function (DUF4435)
MSIHEHKTAGTIVAELRMTRTKLPHGSFLLIEGTDDKRFWSRWIDQRTSTAIISGGKKNLLGALRKLDTAGFRGALGIADADLDRLRRTVCPSPNLAWTHAHDLETSLVQLGVARAVVQELGDIDRLHAFEHREGTTLEAALLARALAFGRVRCAQALHDPDLDLSWLKVARFVDRAWSVRQAEIDRVAAAEGLAPALGAVASWFDAHTATDPWDLVNGHDLVELLTAGLRGTFGSLPAGRGPRDVAAALRLAVDSAELRASPLFEAVQVWEQSNAPYVVLRAMS